MHIIEEEDSLTGNHLELRGHVPGRARKYCRTTPTNDRLVNQQPHRRLIIDASSMFSGQQLESKSTKTGSK